jgi:hypothetical protein
MKALRCAANFRTVETGGTGRQRSAPKKIHYNEDPDPPRDFRPGPLEYMHKDTAFNMSRPTVRVRAEDIPEDFYQMMALDMLSGQDAADQVEEAPRVSPSNWAQGTPQRSTEAGDAGIRRLRLDALTSTPPTRIGVKPATPGTPNGLDVRRKVDRLKRMDWALNPFALGDEDYLYLKTRLMKVLEGMTGTEFSGMVSDITDLTFWTVLSKLVRGKVRSEKQRAEELVKKICGSAEGKVLKQHDHLRSKHD